MGKLSSSVVLTLYSTLIISIANAYGHEHDNVIVMPGSEKPIKPLDKWFESLDQAKEVRTKLHFYFQDVNGGTNPTVWKIAECAITSKSPSTFGQVSMVDDSLTVGPGSDSGVVGRAQGTIGFADMDDTAIQMGLNIVFTSGEYNGSTISILGRNPIFKKDRELAIVGGTGVFRLARGVALSNTYSYDVDTSYGVLEYTLYVVHYAV